MCRKSHREREQRMVEVEGAKDQIKMHTTPKDKLVDWERFGSYDHIVRVLAWMHHFINNLRE